MLQAVVVEPGKEPRAVILQDVSEIRALIGCETVEPWSPPYFGLFTDPRYRSYRKQHHVIRWFDPEMAMWLNEHYWRDGGPINKMLSDLYSAGCREPYPILGTGVIVDCDREQLFLMYNHIPLFLASIDQMKLEHRAILLSRDVSGYEALLRNRGNG